MISTESLLKMADAALKNLNASYSLALDSNYANCHLCGDKMYTSEVALFYACCGEEFTSVTCAVCWVSPHAQHKIKRNVAFQFSTEVFHALKYAPPNIKQIYYDMRRICPYLRDGKVDIYNYLSADCIELRFTFVYRVPGGLCNHLPNDVAAIVGKSLIHCQDAMSTYWPQLSHLTYGNK